MDRARHQYSSNRGTNSARHIVAYQGYASPREVFLSGRVLSNKPSGGPLDDDGWWENLANTYHRWESDEIAGAAVTIRYREHKLTVSTDDEGYYHATFPAGEPVHQGLVWTTASACTLSHGTEIQAFHEIMVPPPNAAFGVISDLDDTVIHTGIASLLLAAKLTFLENAKTRKPLDGVAKLYEALQMGQAMKPVNPIFYISSSPWNLYDLLVDFLRLNEIPAGPLQLRDWGLDRNKFVKEPGHGDKREKALLLLDRYVDLPFVLIGDSGQEDPAIYAEITRLRPGRVKSIYIRDVDPAMNSLRDVRVARAVETAEAAGVPLVLARDSVTISEHASSLSLIPASAQSEVSAEVAKDEARPEVGAQAVKDAAQSLIPRERE